MDQPGTDDKLLGIICGVLSAIFVAGYVTTNKYIYAHYDVGAFEYSLIFAMSGALFAFGSLAPQLTKSTCRLIKANAPALLLLGLAGTVAVGAFTIGQMHTSAINASLLMTLTIVGTALFSHIFLREKHTRHQALWIAPLFVGLYIGVVGFQAIHLRLGDLIVIGSVVVFGLGNAYSRVVMKRMGGAKIVPDIRLIIGGLIALAIALVFVDSFAVTWRILPWALLAGIFYWLCMKAFAKAVFLVNANNAIVLNNSQIFFTSVAGVVLLAEAYSVEKFIGSVIAIVAIYFIVGNKRTRKAHTTN